MLHTKFREIDPPVLRRRFLKGFTMYGRGGHLGHVTLTIYTNFGSPFPRRLHINFALIGQAISEERMFDGGRTDADG